ncbi:MAG: uracil-DNA glycosylase [Pseudomonadota bacterium]
MTMTDSWTAALDGEKESPHFRAVMQFLDDQRARHVTVYPAKDRLFAALKCTPLNEVKVVILGQDPYHGPGQANGLCFSVNPGVALPPSLLNIFKELQADLGIPLSRHGDLSHWAKQGVLLLNTVLSVAAGQPQSHQGKGWEPFTDRIIREVNARCPHVVFLLWGKPAQSKLGMIDQSRHTVLTAPHPSPLSAHRGFFGCRHFSRCNAALAAHGQSPIDWALPAPHS